MKIWTMVFALFAFAFVIPEARAGQCDHYSTQSRVYVYPFCTERRGHHYDYGHQRQRPRYGRSSPYDQFFARNTRRPQGRVVFRRMERVVSYRREVDMRHRPDPPTIDWRAENPRTFTCEGKAPGHPFRCGDESPTGICTCP